MLVTIIYLWIVNGFTLVLAIGENNASDKSGKNSTTIFVVTLIINIILLVGRNVGVIR